MNIHSPVSSIIWRKLHSSILTTEEMVELKAYGPLATKKLTRRQPTRHQVKTLQ